MSGAPLLTGGEPWVGRGLTAETTGLFRYHKIEANDEVWHVAPYYDDDKRLVAQKLRGKGKKFQTRGDINEAGLFGQNLWASGGKKLVITEGEIDAMSVSQVQNNKWPVVSIPNGAQGAAKAIRRNLAFVESFEQVILMFDMDEAGQEAALEVAQLLSPGKAHLAHLSLKDPNAMLVDGRVDELRSAVFKAKQWMPDGFIMGGTLWERMAETPEEPPGVPYPWDFLTEQLDAMRFGEVLTLCAGPGVGKSTFGREVMYHLAMKGERVGILALEENIERTAWGLVGLHLGAPLHRSRVGFAPEVLHAGFEEVFGDSKVVLYDHHGATGEESLLSRIRYMVVSLGCRFIFLDHLTIALTQVGGEVRDERQLIDRVMTRLVTLATELHAHITIVVHLKYQEGKPWDRGREISQQDLRGSSQIAGLSHTILGIERNLQAKESGDVMTVRVVKDRWTGNTGPAGWLRFDKTTGRLAPCEAPGNDAAASDYGLDGDEGEF